MNKELNEEIKKTEEMSEVADNQLDEVNGGAVRFSDAPKGSIVSGGRASTSNSIVNILGRDKVAANAPAGNSTVRRKSIYKNT